MRAGRKYKLHLILATTSLEDLKESHHTLYHQIWTNSPIKVLFGDLPEEQLESLAKEFYLQELNLKQKKLELYRTFFEPQESSRTVNSESWGGGITGMESSSLLYSGEDFFPFQRGESEAESWSSFGGKGRAEVPFYEFSEREEVSSIQFWSLEEQLHKAKAKLKSLGPREIVIKQRGKGLKFEEVPKLQTIELPEDVLEKAKQQIYTNQACYSTIEEIEKERAQRLKELGAERRTKIEDI